MQVQNSGKLVGIVCSDVSGDDLFNDVAYFQQGELSYAFLVDQQGRIMMHPLYPRPASPSDDPVFVKMTDLERAPETKEILKEMLRRVQISTGASCFIA